MSEITEELTNEEIKNAVEALINASGSDRLKTDIRMKVAEACGYADALQEKRSNATTEKEKEK